MASISSSAQCKDLEGLSEFQKIPLNYSSRHYLEELYNGINLPPSKITEEQREKILKPRPTVQPIVRRRRAQIPKNVATSSSAVVPASNCSNLQVNSSVATVTVARASETHEQLPPASESFIELLQTTKPTSSRVTARKSTTGKVHKIRSPPEKKLKPCRVVLLDLKNSNLGKDIEHLSRQCNKALQHLKTAAEIKSSIKIPERKESTDSGLASEDDTSSELAECENGRSVPPLKIKLVQKTSSKVGSSKNVKKMRVAPPSYIAKKRKDGLSNEKERNPPKKSAKERFHSKATKHPKTGEATPKQAPQKNTAGNRESLRKGIHKVEQKPSFWVSIPWDNNLRVVPPLPDRIRYLDNNNIDDLHTNDKTGLPVDVVPTIEFDLEHLEMSPLVRKRYEDPAPLRFFSPYEGRKYVCVCCNIHFKSKQDLASHKLANHHTFNY